jgi:hypothetical protein
VVYLVQELPVSLWASDVHEHPRDLSSRAGLEPDDDAAGERNANPRVGERLATTSRCGTRFAQIRVPGSDAAEVGVLGQDGGSPWLRDALGFRRNVSDGSSPKRCS